MNVKLNNELSKIIPGKMCIMPLSGDQGASIGLYQAMEGDLDWPDHLYWGTREYYSIDYERIHMFTDDVNEYEPFIISLLQRDCIVNVVRGSMEFGARALGNTTTLARPTKENVEYINHLNGRNTIMPMAPVMSKKAANRLFNGTMDIHQSLEYMICTRDFRRLPDELAGAAHNVPTYDPDNTTGFTGRPQIIDLEHWLYPILTYLPYETLINTSFNEHGMPICYSMQDILRCHQYQLSNDTEQRVCTVIIT